MYYGAQRNAPLRLAVHLYAIASLIAPQSQVYDSYGTEVSEWARLLSRDGDLTVRGTELDAIFLALYVERERDEALILRGSFDGF